MTKTHVTQELIQGLQRTQSQDVWVRRDHVEAILGKEDTEELNIQSVSFHEKILMSKREQARRNKPAPESIYTLMYVERKTLLDELIGRVAHQVRPTEQVSVIQEIENAGNQA